MKINNLKRVEEKNKLWRNAHALTFADRKDD